MRKVFGFLLVLTMLLSLPRVSLAAKLSSPSVSPSASPSATPTIAPAPIDITQKSSESIGPLEKILQDQSLGIVWPFNPVKYAIRGAVASGVPVNTIVLLLLLPISTFVIALSRNIVGIRGFGIFLPAALSVVFIATGPVVGIGLFLVIVTVSTLVRLVMRKLKLRLQYLPRMSFIFWAVVVATLGVLFMAPVLKFPALANVSIFAVLILILLAEDFIRVQLGKSIKTAITLSLETLILAFISYLFLTLKPIEQYVLLNPEISLLGIGVLDLVLGRYTGLRFMEFYRFRKLIKS